LEAVERFGNFSDFDYVSMSGGAMLEFMAGKELPGLAALE
jgi:3-phosphoglycerate kinase